MNTSRRVAAARLTTVDDGRMVREWPEKIPRWRAGVIFFISRTTCTGGCCIVDENMRLREKKNTKTSIRNGGGPTAQKLFPRIGQTDGDADDCTTAATATRRQTADDDGTTRGPRALPYRAVLGSALEWGAT